MQLYMSVLFLSCVGLHIVPTMSGPVNTEDMERSMNTCECAQVTSTGRIVGGKEVTPKYKLPYQVYFQAGNQMCGGTIINQRYVITAAHCVYSGQTLLQPGTHSLLVVAGEHNICDGANEGGQVIKVEQVHVRSDYNQKQKMENDFAILKLASNIKFTANVKPACLPEKAAKSYSGQMATVSGWGGTVGYRYRQNPRPTQPRQCELKETSVKILKPTDDLCAKSSDKDSQTKLCGYAEGTDSCQGDSGGPLTVVEGGKYVLVGVVSYGAGCADKYPGVYARVQNYLEWIKQLTADGECKKGSTSAPTPSTSATASPSSSSTASPSTTGGDYYNYDIY